MPHMLSGHWSVPLDFRAARLEQGSVAAFSTLLLRSSEISWFWLLQSLRFPQRSSVSGQTGCRALSAAAIAVESWFPGSPGIISVMGTCC